LTAVVLRKSGNLYGSAREVIQGLQRFPGHLQLRIEMARIYFLLGKLPESKAQIDVVLNQEPNHLHALYLDGLIFIKKGLFEEAEFRLQNVLGMKKVSVSLLPALHNNLGLAIESIALSQKNQNPEIAKKRFQEALDHYNKALSYNSDSPLYKKNKERVSLQL
ncbi:MAG: hypothetical protein OEZ34_08440, partial [Spirochaetia bacterium]|nr:hypothetical protein [Spirochaetia bacterium]